MPPVKKTWLIDPALVRRAQQITCSRTETETVTRALQEIVFRDEVEKAFERYGPTLAGLELVCRDNVLQSSRHPKRRK